MVADFYTEVKSSSLSIYFCEEPGKWLKLEPNHANLIIPVHVVGVDKDFSLR